MVFTRKRNNKMSKINGPQFLRFFAPLLEVLKELGGSGNVSEVTDLVVEKMQIPEEELEEKLKSGTSRIKNQIAWARNYLVRAGLMDDSSKRGIWSLTEEGFRKEIDKEEAIKIFKEVQSRYTKTNSQKSENKVEFEEQEENVRVIEENYAERLLDILQNIPPEGFERICQRLLRESGFKKVVVTGKTGDGGIDGEGILEINPLMSFKVLFQAKRYLGTVGSPTIRDFRGAMQGRADKGIIITTGRFSNDAKKEAIREGAPPIELVDGENLVELFEKNNLGLKPKIIYEIDEDFFEEFR